MYSVGFPKMDELDLLTKSAKYESRECILKRSFCCLRFLSRHLVKNGSTRTLYEICSKLTNSLNVNDVVLVSLLLTLNKFHTLIWCFCCWLWTSQHQLCWLDERKCIIVLMARICSELTIQNTRTISSTLFQ